MPDDTPPPAPPGTVEEGFWHRSATRAALVVTLGLLVMAGRAELTHQPLSPDALAVALEGIVWAWAAAFGLHKTTDSLRWK